MMRIFTAHLSTETNTFSPIVTDLAAFEAGGVFHGDASLHRNRSSVGQILFQWRELAARDGHAVIESLAAHAQPGGRTLQSVYEGFRAEILGDLRKAGSVDVVLLALHGAMASESCDDCEGDLLSAIRATVGPDVVIAAELDLHCHATRAMFAASDLLVTYKEYPHTDYLPRARDVYRLAMAARAGRVHPTTAVVDCRMVGLWRTTEEPMTSFVRHIEHLEAEPGILSISLGHGFPWGDVPEVGAKVWVISDGQPERAQRLASQLADRFWRLQRHMPDSYVGVEQALDSLSPTSGAPVVLADVADNPGGGAPGDSTFILEALLERGLTGIATGYYWAPELVTVAERAGIGATVRVQLGGGFGPISGARITLDGVVRAVSPGMTQSGLAGRWLNVGAAAWIHVRGIDIVATTRRVQTMSPDIFAGLGLRLREKTAVVVKSTQHFFAGFSELASRVLYVATPGALSPDFAAIPYVRRIRDFWPAVADPFAGLTAEQEHAG